MADLTSSREKILKKIRKALIQPSATEYLHVDIETPVFVKSAEPPEVVFAQQFISNNGNFIYCANQNELIENLSVLAGKYTNISCSNSEILQVLQKHFPDLEIDTAMRPETELSLGTCECLVARSGSILTSSALPGGRIQPFYAETHVVIASCSQIVLDTKDALLLLKEKYKNDLPSSFTFITGPSRSADIEQTLVQGAHGPVQLYCLLLEDNL